jgi:acetyltransferase-like isoleucine patch superfamily enzyme
MLKFIYTIFYLFDKVLNFIITTIKLNRGNIFVKEKLKLKYNSRLRSWTSEGSIVIGKNVSLGYNSELFVYQGKIQIGNNTSINDNCKIYENVNIGSSCLLASNIFISSGSHTIIKGVNLPIKSQDKSYPSDKRIIIDDDCWIGFGVVIMPGVYVGKGSVIGSNAVVTKDVFPYSIMGGVPAKEIGMRFDFNNSFCEINILNDSNLPFFYKGINYAQFDNLESLKGGLEINLDKATFLLKNVKFKELNITGYCLNKTHFHIFINGIDALKTIIKEGEFNINCMVNIAEKHSYNLTDQYSDEIIQKFNIIEVITNFTEVKNSGSIKWKVKSVKISQ